MEPHDLKSYETIFEISCRGLQPKPVQTLRRAQLRCAMNTASSTNFCAVGDFETNKAEILQTIRELHEILDDESKELSSSELRRVNSRLLHLKNRVSLLVACNEEEEKCKGDFLSEVSFIESLIYYHVTNFDQLTISEPNNLSHPVSTSTVREPVDSSRPTTIVHSYASPNSKPIPVSQWKLQFSGNVQKLSVMSFLERVQELKVARNISDQELFRTCIDLFSDKALSWYRSIRNSVNTWRELTVLLKRDFLPEDYDECLLSEIRNRTQGSQEDVLSYILAVESLFLRLGERKSEKYIVRQTVRNLHPTFANALVLHELSSISELKECCRRIEDIQIRASKYRTPPSKRSELLEPDLACLPARDSKSTADDNLPKNLQIERSKVDNRCWNCGLGNHLFRSCTQPSSIFCYLCGKKNFTIKTCPNAHSKNVHAGVSPQSRSSQGVTPKSIVSNEFRQTQSSTTSSPHNH